MNMFLVRTLIGIFLGSIGDVGNDVTTFALHNAMTDHQARLSEEVTLRHVFFFFFDFFRYPLHHTSQSEENN